jgi:hypothetical protein
MAKLNRPLVARKPLAVVLSALCLSGLVTGGSVAAAAVSGGTNFHAAEDDGQAVAIAFSRDGRRVTRAFANVWMKCSDGETYQQSFSVDSIRVTARGAFNGLLDTGPMDSESGAESRHFVATFKGRRTRTRVAGTLQATLNHTTRATGATVTCESGRVKYVAID